MCLSWEITGGLKWKSITVVTCEPPQSPEELPAVWQHPLMASTVRREQGYLMGTSCPACSAKLCSLLLAGSLPSGPRSSSSAPASNQPASSTMNPNMPFTSSPDPSPSQNPLSLMMSQMSKYAMPSSTPLYHNAIKTIATSDDELLPDRPMLPPGSMAGMRL